MANEYPTKHLYKEGKLGGEVRVVRDEQGELAARASGFSELSGFQEYPKHLHKKGDREGEELVCKDAEEEAAARKKGFRTIHEAEAKQVDEVEEKKK